MRRIIIYLSCFALVVTIVVSGVLISDRQSVSASSTARVEATSTETLIIITEPSEIDNALKEKGLYKEDEEVITVIQLDINGYSLEDAFDVQSDYFLEWIWSREFYAKLIGREEIVQDSPENINNYPGGSFSLEWTYNPYWQVERVFNIENDILEKAIGISLNSSDTSSYTYESQIYSDEITVELYLNYERAYLYLYDEDIIFDDFVGMTMLEREAGYTIKVIRR